MNIRSTFDRSAEKVNDSRANRQRHLELALPYHQNFPSKGPELSNIPPITRAIGLDLGLPEGFVRFRQLALPAAMAMPETTMHEDYFFGGAENDVGLAR